MIVRCGPQRLARRLARGAALLAKVIEEIALPVHRPDADMCAHRSLVLAEEPRQRLRRDGEAEVGQEDRGVLPREQSFDALRTVAGHVQLLLSYPQACPRLGAGCALSTGLSVPIDRHSEACRQGRKRRETIGNNGKQQNATVLARAKGKRVPRRARARPLARAARDG